MSRVIAAVAAACFSFVASVTAFGGSANADEPYPSKPIRLILPQPAGGAVDLIARSLADRLSESMRQPVIVETTMFDRGRADYSGEDLAGVYYHSRDGQETLIVAND